MRRRGKVGYRLGGADGSYTLHGAGRFDGFGIETPGDQIVTVDNHPYLAHGGGKRVAGGEHTGELDAAGGRRVPLRPLDIVPAAAVHCSTCRT
jgi:hypothetical protein